MKPHLKQWPEMFSSLPWVILVFVGNNFIFRLQLRELMASVPVSVRVLLRNPWVDMA